MYWMSHLCWNFIFPPRWITETLAIASKFLNAQQVLPANTHFILSSTSLLCATLLKNNILLLFLFFVFLIPRFVALWLLTYSSDQPSPHSLSPCVHQAFRMRGRETPKHESLKDVKRKIDHCRCTCKNNSVQWREREMGTEEEGDGSISLLSSS